MKHNVRDKVTVVTGWPLIFIQNTSTSQYFFFFAISQYNAVYFYHEVENPESQYTFQSSIQNNPNLSKFCSKFAIAVHAVHPSTKDHHVWRDICFKFCLKRIIAIELWRMAFCSAHLSLISDLSIILYPALHRSRKNKRFKNPD